MERSKPYIEYAFTEQESERLYDALKDGGFRIESFGEGDMNSVTNIYEEDRLVSTVKNHNQRRMSISVEVMGSLDKFLLKQLIRAGNL